MAGDTWITSHELARQIKTAAFERTILFDKKLAPKLRVLPLDATGVICPASIFDAMVWKLSEEFRFGHPRVRAQWASSNIVHPTRDMVFDCYPR